MAPGPSMAATRSRTCRTSRLDSRRVAASATASDLGELVWTVSIRFSRIRCSSRPVRPSPPTSHRRSKVLIRRENLFGHQQLRHARRRCTSARPPQSTDSRAARPRTARPWGRSGGDRVNDRPFSPSSMTSGRNARESRASCGYQCRRRCRCQRRGQATVSIVRSNTAFLRRLCRTPGPILKPTVGNEIVEQIIRHAREAHGLRLSLFATDAGLRNKQNSHSGSRRTL